MAGSLLTTAANVMLLSVSTLVALLVAELSARLLAGPAPSDAGHHRLLCEYDPLLGWRKIPGAQKRYTTLEYDIEERINSKGLRGPEIAYEKPAGVFRLLVLGDSFTEGYTVEEKDTVTEVLGRSLTARWGRRRVQVVNGGTGGYSTDQELLFFRSEGWKYGPDLVILMVVDNDIWFNAQAQYPRAPKPLFQLREGELVLTNMPVPDRSRDARPAPAPEPQSALVQLKLALSDHLALYRIVRDRVKGTHSLYRAAIGLGLAEAPDEGGGSAIPVPDEWRVLEKVPPAFVQQAWILTEALLLGLRAEVEAAGARLLVVKVPSSVDLYEDRWRALKRKYGIADDAWSPSTVTRRLAEICARNRIELLDLTPAFAAAIEQGLDQPEPLYFALDGHWTASGHRLAGERLSEYLAIPGVPAYVDAPARTGE